MRRERMVNTPNRSRSAPLIALAFVFLPLNAGILLYTAKNAADVRESREVLAGVKRSIDGLKLHIEKQTRNIARTEEMAVVRQRLEVLQKDIANLDDRLRTGMLGSGGALVLSAPGKGVTQRLQPSVSASGAGEVPEDSPPTIGAEGVSLADLPRYERSVSPEGKLILRKVR
ncbi:hypothetical protein PYH38_000491 [Sinorhizobium numidicum]|uniref:Uncharacterized protein n=1 Tax=Sinorhizobium numidicum TaxID=680248 RepID=A0ABY8CR52_9HYPH|nr:hypothetical protein [Sinorhizobium numidicum]WEX81125.1 hypothetical protein PYH38_000491 [Sinorhizobium numidicum]